MPNHDFPRLAKVSLPFMNIYDIIVLIVGKANTNQYTDCYCAVRFDHTLDMSSPTRIRGWIPSTPDRSCNVIHEEWIKWIDGAQ